MVKVIEFRTTRMYPRDSDAAGGLYVCKSPGKCSGRYVREADYLALDNMLIERDKQLIALLERHKRLVEAAKSVTGWDWFEILRYADLQDAEPQLDIQRLEAALAEEVK